LRSCSNATRTHYRNATSFGYDVNVPYRPFSDQNCSVAGALSIVGDRWTLLVMREVLFGRRRFAEIKRNTGIAPNILSDRLQVLVEHGLLHRRRYSEHPESYEYSPTPKGLDINPVILALMHWGDQYASPSAGPPRVAVHAKCGHDADPELHCSHCGEVLRTVEMTTRPGPGANAAQLAAGVLPRA
jgi:DNA-binding HxlR family transcriptional regulator